jgi:hypothetical protein
MITVLLLVTGGESLYGKWRRAVDPEDAAAEEE